MYGGRGPRRPLSRRIPDASTRYSRPFASTRVSTWDQCQGPYGPDGASSTAWGAPRPNGTDSGVGRELFCYQAGRNAPNFLFSGGGGAPANDFRGFDGRVRGSGAPTNSGRLERPRCVDGIGAPINAVRLCRRTAPGNGAPRGRNGRRRRGSGGIEHRRLSKLTCATMKLRVRRRRKIEGGKPVPGLRVERDGFRRRATGSPRSGRVKRIPTRNVVERSSDIPFEGAICLIIPLLQRE